MNTVVAPLVLQPDNFTPAARTPWGGTRIVRKYKAGLLPLTQSNVGESWEISFEPDFPVRCDSGENLIEVVTRNPRAYLGNEAARSGSALLVKLLDAEDDLSVQIHPPNDYPSLNAGETGKPETWYIIDADHGAGLYLGLREGVRKERLRSALELGEDVSTLFYFVEVRPGDFFVIEPGMPHAIGRGVTLVEPQYVLPGRRGVTYRFYDWNRRYDEHGKQDRSGKPRALHVKEAIDVLSWDGPREAALLEKVRFRAGLPTSEQDAVETRLCGDASAPLASPWLRVSRLAGTGALTLTGTRYLRGLTVLSGDIRLVGSGFDMSVSQGRSAVIPAEVVHLRAELQQAHAILSSAAC